MALSLKGGCIVETSLGFSLNSLISLFVGDKGIYSMGDKYKSHT